MADIGVMELCGILAAIAGGVGGPIAVIRWVGGYVERSIGEAVTTQDAKNAPVIDGIRHKVANVTTRVDALERFRTDDVTRIVKLEATTVAIEKGQERIEHAIDTMKSDQAAGRAEIIDTLREISKRDLKS